MKSASDIIQEGIHGQNLDKVIDILNSIKESNPIVWFTLYKVLQRIKNGWEEEILPIERSNEIENKFKSILSKLLNNIENKSLNDACADLEELIKLYISEYI